MEALLVDINQAGLGRGLQFELFKPATTETIHAFYAELPVSIRVTGGYHDIGAFTSDTCHPLDKGSKKSAWWWRRWWGP